MITVRANELTPGGALRGVHAQAIANLLINRGFAVLPSDTCYALAAIPSGFSMSQAINQILDRKLEPISLAFDSVSRVGNWVDLSPFSARLLEHFTPGPLTVVCPLRADVKPEIALDVLAAPDKTIGVRISDSRVETQMVSACDSPLTTVAIRTRDKARRPVTDFEEARRIVKEGLALIGNPYPLAVVEVSQNFATDHSTVVRVPSRSGGGIYDFLRAGTITQEQIEESLREMSQWEISDFT